VTGTAWSKPAFAIGDFVVLAGETVGAMFRRPFAWRELLDQIWFVARVSIVPTLVLSIPYTVLIVFTMNIVLIEVGAADLSGAGAALASVTHVGPVVTAIVVSGAGATAMCADLGARTIREALFCGGGRRTRRQVGPRTAGAAGQSGEPRGDTIQSGPRASCTAVSRRTRT
jgi:phospholipid/cholesterol/gamma-HCH transport system permease protein